MGPRLLLDTNVWLDFFLDRSAMHDAACELVARSFDRDVELLAALASVKDCYFLIGAELKRLERQTAGGVSEEAATATQEIAWSCVASIRKFAYVVPADDSDMVEAIMLRSAHQDFEDNLVVAAARRARADYLVTSDKQLLQHQPVKCATIQEALDLMPHE